MTCVLRPALCALAVLITAACGQMGPLVMPDPNGAAEPAGPPAAQPAKTAPEHKDLQPESAPLQVP